MRRMRWHVSRMPASAEFVEFEVDPFTFGPCLMSVMCKECGCLVAALRWCKSINLHACCTAAQSCRRAVC